MKLLQLLSLIMLLAFVSCSNESKIKDVIRNNPKVILEGLDKDPEAFLDFLEKLTMKAREIQAKKQQEEEAKRLEDAFSNPLVPEIRKDEVVRGTKGAPILLVEYSDFECPFCSRGYTTVKELLKEYEGKIAFVYKHLPLSFHQNAEIASRYYEALKLQSHDMAIKFHDKIYENQGELRNAETFLKKIAKELGADLNKLQKDVKSEVVTKKIEEDKAEAEKFDFSGTPGFLLNGVPVKGAYPKSHFVGIIEEINKRGKIKL